ncbi:hypothetical protein S40285_08773, partial [Stachybotrys chlorohalonatus IBT 40285]
GYFKTI